MTEISILSTSQTIITEYFERLYGFHNLSENNSVHDLFNTKKFGIFTQELMFGGLVESVLEKKL